MLVVLLLCALMMVGFGTGSAYAFFTSSTAGVGSGSTAALQSVSVVGFQDGDAVTTPLQPGTTGDVILRIYNPNSFNVSLVSVSPGAISDGNSGCDASNITFNTPTNLPMTVVPGTALYHLTGAATLSANAPNACQSAAFNIPLASFQVQA